MQLILDADNIDIQRNMSTVEQEPLNEKFLTDKVIAHLADDITTGNKENIQKQENIIVPIDDNVVDTGKEITATDDVLTENLNRDSVHSEDVHTSEVIEDKNITNDQEQGSILIQENIIKEESQVLENETNSEKINNADITDTEPIKEDDTDAERVDENVTVEDTEKVKEIDNKKIPTEEENKSNLDKEVDTLELSTELNEETKLDLDKVVNIAHKLTELRGEDNTVENNVESVPENKLEKENDVEMDIVDTVPEKKLEQENDTEMTIVDTVPENKLEKDIEMDTEDTVLEKVGAKKSIETEIPNTGLEDISLETENTECDHIDNIVEKNTAIEIDDEDEKTSDRSKSDSKSLDKTEDAELIEDIDESAQEDSTAKKVSEVPEQPKRICGLSNNLDIFSDEEDDIPSVESPKENVENLNEKQCINIDDDDDIMLIDEDSSLKKGTSIENAETNSVTDKNLPVLENINKPNDENDTSTDNKEVTDIIEETPLSEAEKEVTLATTNDTSHIPVTETNKVAVDKVEATEKPKKPLLPKNFLDTCKKNLSDMTRNDLEEFCILKIVESIVDRSNLGEIKAHLKNLTRTMEECKKKYFMLSKQNKDLQVVLKSVQEEQKMGSDVHITPLKITRSVGMQVVMIADKGNNMNNNNNTRKKITNGVSSPVPVVPNNNSKQIRNQIQNPRNQKEKASMNQQIPVPRLVPATPPAAKINQSNTNSTPTKQINNTTLPNGMRISPPVQKAPEKRGRSLAVTVDLTDDEPPTKLQNVQRGPVNQPMRVLTTAPNLMPAQRFSQNINSPRKVYIPISAPQGQNVRPGQTIMLKTLPGLGPRPRAQTQALISKAPQNTNQVRFGRGQQLNRHPAPLPDAMKQYQPPNWKSLPPAPDLKLSKVENGIVISWKIDGYEEENHEEIASYQLYAYQETSSPPNTALWKKIGDVKALPLPMACTLTQFMAGYKYYFAVRAVDIRSRFGPFSLPGSILLLNKM